MACLLESLKRLLARGAPPVTHVNPAVQAALVRHARLPDDLTAIDAATPPVQVDGDPAPGARAAHAPAAGAPRDAFIVAGGLGLPAAALVNVRNPLPQVELWSLDGATPHDGSTFATRLALRWPSHRPPTGWQVSSMTPLPRLQCLVALRRDDAPRTALLAVIDLATGALREIDLAEPDPFAHTPSHVATLGLDADSVLVRWHRGRVALGRWGDVAAEDVVVLFSPRERDGLELLRLSLDDGNIHRWGLRGHILWLKTIDGRLRPVPREFAWSLELDRVV